MENQTEKPTFDLEAPAINNYVNMILNDMKNYQALSAQRFERGASFYRVLLALKTLIMDMPPKGKEYMKQQVPEFDFQNIETVSQELNNLGLEKAYEAMDTVFDVVNSWLWPNLLELHLNNAKPAYQTTSHLRNK